MTLPGDDVKYRWVSEGKYGYWERMQEHEKALQVLEDAGMLPEVTQEELPA